MSCGSKIVDLLEHFRTSTSTLITSLEQTNIGQVERPHPAEAMQAVVEAHESIQKAIDSLINTYGFGPSQPFHLSKYKTIHLPSNKAVSEDDALVNSIELIKKQRSRSHEQLVSLVQTLRQAEEQLVRVITDGKKIIDIAESGAQRRVSFEDAVTFAERLAFYVSDHGDDNKTRAMPPAPQESTLKAASLYELAKFDPTARSLKVHQQAQRKAGIVPSCPPSAVPSTASPPRPTSAIPPSPSRPTPPTHPVSAPPFPSVHQEKAASLKRASSASLPQHVPSSALPPPMPSPLSSTEGNLIREEHSFKSKASFSLGLDSDSD